MPDPFTPHHTVAVGGATTWSEPDPAAAGDGHLDAGLPVEVIAETTGWAHVRCSNDFETWLDAGLLVPVPEPGVPATHRVDAQGAPTRLRPELADAPDQRLDPGLEVVELFRWGTWSRVRCSNGWETWVEALRLAPIRARGSTGGEQLAVGMPIVGAALVVLGSFLAWFTAAGTSASAWDLPWVGLATRDATDVNVDAGPLLLVVVLVALPLLTRRALPGWIVALPGTFAAVTAVLAFRFYFDLPDPRPDLGIGLVISTVGALVILAGAAVSHRTS